MTGSESQRPRPQRSSAQTQAFLDRMLSLNPVSQAEAMLNLRWRYLGLKSHSTVSVDPQDLAQRRKKIQTRLEEIRASFWTMSAAQLRKNLDALPVRDLPEIKLGVERLKLLTLYRDDLQKLGTHKHREINLYNTFRRIVMLPPRKAGAIKERYLRDLPYSDVKPKVEKMVRMMRSEYPDLYAIESDWFQQILKIKSRNAKAKSQDGGGFEFEFGIPGWMIGLIVLLIIRILFSVMRSMV